MTSLVEHDAVQVKPGRLVHDGAPHLSRGGRLGVGTCHAFLVVDTTSLDVVTVAECHIASIVTLH